MKIKIQQFLGENHSWSMCGQNIARAFISQGHDVHLQSTNGYDYFPEDLKPYIKEKLEKEYDMQLSYTAMKNFPHLLSCGKKNRFGIWNMDGTVLPVGFAKYHKYCDKLFPSSSYAAQTFINGGVPKEKIVVVPHGIDLQEFSNNEKYPLKSKKKIKILSNVAQPHLRKNIPNMFEAFGRAFTKEDDVCLVCKINVKKASKSQPKPKPQKAVKSKRAARRLETKTKDNKQQQEVKQFDVDFWNIYNDFCKKYPNHAEVEIITDFLPSMTPLYNSVDINFSMTRLECWYLPGSESLATNTINVVSRYGGHLDFLNDDNAILIEGKEVRCPNEAQYWVSSPHAAWFDPFIDDAVEKLRYVVNNYDAVSSRVFPLAQKQIQEMTWLNVASQIINICE